MGEAVTYDVLLTREPNEQYTARVLAMPEMAATAASEAEALQELRTLLVRLHQTGRVVQLEVPVQGKAHENPWLRFAGMWKDDPDGDRFLEEIAAYRGHIDRRTLGEDDFRALHP